MTASCRCGALIVVQDDCTRCMDCNALAGRYDCEVCDGTGKFTGYDTESGKFAPLPCPACSGTGVDPARAEELERCKKWAKDRNELA